MSRMQAELLSETSTIVDAVRRIRQDTRIIAAARQNVADALDLLGLTGTPREAVKPLLVAAAANGVAAHVYTPRIFWFG